MRGDCGFFVGRVGDSAKPTRLIGGFFSWKVGMQPVRIGMDGNSPVYRVGHYRLALQNWWLNEAGLTTAKAVFCRIFKDGLIPILEEEIRPGEYVPGRRNKELIIEKAVPRVGREPA